MKILFECHHGLGDVVMTFPALKNLREKYPSAEIVYLAGNEIEIELIEGTGLVNRVLVFNPQKGGLKELLTLGIKLRKEHFDIGISLGQSPKGYDLVYMKAIGCKKIIAPKNERSLLKKYLQVDVSDYKHRTEINVAIVAGLVNNYNIEEKTIISHNKKIEAYIEKERLVNIIGLVIGTGDFMYRKGRKVKFYNTKRWKIQNFIELTKRLEADGYQVFWLGGPKEVEACKEQGISMEQKHISLLGQLDICETAAFMKNCRMVIGGDTGLMHIAAAVGVETLTLFGSTDPALIGPYSKNAHYYYADTTCIKCYSECHYKGITCDTIECMDAISVDAVYEKFASICEKSRL